MMPLSSSAQAIGRWIICLTAVMLLTRCRHLPTAEQTRVTIHLAPQYQELARFADEPLEVNFRVMFDVHSRRAYRDVAFFYRAADAGAFQKQDWGVFSANRVTAVFDTLYDYQVTLDSAVLPPRDIEFYIQIGPDEAPLARLPETDGEMLLCRIFEGMEEPGGAFEGMIYIPAGQVRLGPPAADAASDAADYDAQGNKKEKNSGPWGESRSESVSLDGFYIDAYEVSNDDYARFWASAGRSRRPKTWDTPQTHTHVPYRSSQADWPVSGISIRDAAAYCAWQGKRLPTEAQWERAARGDNNLTYPWGDQPVKGAANFRHGDAFTAESPVKSFARGQSPFGCVNMLGNVSEYVWPDDLSPVDEPDQAIVKGGGYMDLAKRLTAYARKIKLAHVQYFYIGFRCAKDE